MFHRLKQWYLRWRGLDVCKYCNDRLDDDGYCFDCNRFPHKKYITEAEALWIDEVEWMKSDPLGYEKHQEEMRELLNKHGIGKIHNEETRSESPDGSTTGGSWDQTNSRE